MILNHDPNIDTPLPDVSDRSQQPQSQAFRKGMAKIPEVLKHLGYERLRPGQDKAVYNLLAHRDTYAVLPTSHGKTAISVVPTVCLGWKTLIFSPLVALMQDQVASLQRLGMQAGQISSGQTPTENQMTLKSWELGELQFMLVAPERLENSEFLRVIKRTKPNLVVVDEAHCLSNWSDSFRASYTKIGNLITAVNPDAVLAMTATSTPEIEGDVRRVLGIPGAAKVLYMPSRRELVLKSMPYKSDNHLLRLLNEESTGATIVYCATKNRCDTLFADLGHLIKGGSLVYHGGMPTDVRVSNQNLFMSDDVRVMFATNAFGMGIDKRNIRMILHRDVPGSLEALSQETGRASRDGKESLCIQLEAPDAFVTHEYLLESSHPDRYTVERVYNALLKYRDAEGKIKQTGKDMADRLGIKEMHVNAALGVLKSSGVIDREDDEAAPCNIQFIRTPDDPKFQVLLSEVRKYGMTMPDSTVDLRLELLLQQTGRKYGTVSNHLKRMEKEGYIIYKTPFRGKTTTIKGDLKLVDFERMRLRKEQAYQKLDAVRDYLRVPDEEKHDFLSEYFGH